MLNNAPDEWKLCQLSDVIKSVHGGGTPDKSKSEYWGGDIFWASVKDIVTFNPHSTQDCITQAGLEASSSKIVPAGTLIVCTRMAVGIGRVYTTDVAINQDLKAIIPNERITRDFLYFWLEFMHDYFKVIATGTTVKGLRQNLLTGAQIKLPPLPEQERISKILSSVDDSIRATEAVIAQVERVKHGLMEGLLTGGLGSKAIARGTVPEGWVVQSIDDWKIALIDGDRGKEYPKSKDFSQSDHCLFLNAKNVTKNGWNFNENNFISKERHLKLRKGTLERGDIVITTRGTIGNLVYYNENIPYKVCRINSGMAIFRNKIDQILTHYLKIQLESTHVQKHIEALTYGTAQPALTIKTLKSLTLPVPPIDEQIRIVNLASEFASEVTVNKAILSNLLRLKRGLMNDLLTGRVRTVS